MDILKETGEKTKPAEKAPNSRHKAPSHESKKTDLVDQMIGDFEKSLKKGAVKVTVGDFIRLVQLRKDMHEEDLKEVRVTWVEPPELESSNKT